MLDLVDVQRTAAPREKPVMDGLAFGSVFTDHMLVVDYEAGRGWTAPRIRPYGALSLDPATAALHYGQIVFEAVKALRGVDGVVRLFRPERHVQRLNASARRLCMPEVEPLSMLRWLRELVRLDQDWAPAEPGTSLYVRPFMFATDAALGVRPSSRYSLVVIMSPVGAYAYDASRPLRIRVEDRYVRAVEGGLGAAKTGGNYAASLLAAEEAHRDGFDQVLWLDGRERRYLDEVGTMNLLLRIGDEVVTPPLGTILDGVTRDTALTLLRDWGVRVSERPIGIDEVVGAARKGSLREVWGTGTASAVQPIGELSYKGESFVVNDGRSGELTQRLAQAIADVQYARAPDCWGWLQAV